jgi:hypothetical protein
VTTPDQPPAVGYLFKSLRVVRALVNCTPPQGQQFPTGDYQVNIQLSDMFQIKESLLFFRQRALVTAPAVMPPEVFAIDVDLEACFAFTKDPPLAPRVFVSDVAPTILFPYTREWVSRLSAQLGVIAPILLPPLNMRERQGPQTEIPPEPESGPTK